VLCVYILLWAVVIADVLAFLSSNIYVTSFLIFILLVVLFPDINDDDDDDDDEICVSAGTLSGPGDLNVVAMAISGFTGDDRNVLWRDQCRSIGANLLNPYLRVLFAFLTVGSGESYEAVLVSCVLTVYTNAFVNIDDSII